MFTIDRRLIISGIVVSFGILLGRVTGFLREIGIASVFGISTEADITILMLTIPDVLVNLLVAGGLSAALIPEFKSLAPRCANALFYQASVVFGVLSICLVIFLNYFVAELVLILAPGLSDGVALVAQRLVSDSLWLIPLSVAASVSTAFLQSQERFVIPSLGTFIFNSVIILGLYLFVDISGNLKDLVWFILLGGILRWGSQLLALSNKIHWFQFDKEFRLNWNLLRRYGQAILAIGLTTLLPVVGRAFASYSGEGGIAAFNYAWKLIELPVGLVLASFSIVLFPRMSSLAAEAREADIEALFKSGVFWSVSFSTVFMIPIFLSPETFVFPVYGWSSSLDADSLRMISHLTQFSVLILPMQAFVLMAMAQFNARKETKVTVWVSLMGMSSLIISATWAVNSFGLFGLIFAIIGSLTLMSVAYILVLLCLGRSIIVEFFKGLAISGIVTTSLIFPAVAPSSDHSTSVVLLLCLMLLSVIILILSNRSNIGLVLNLIRGDTKVR